MVEIRLYARRSIPSGLSKDGFLQVDLALTWCYRQNMITCTWCSGDIESMSKGQRDRFRATGRVYCDKTCSSAYRSQVSSTTMARTNRKYASERMKLRNPMRHSEIREKVSSTLISMGHKPPIQGGNGRGLTKSQQVLSEALGWPTEIIVSTGKGSRKKGLPTHYKIDIANPTTKIAIEVDGASHQAFVVQRRDQRKTEFLRGIGWTVLRFSNQAVMDDTAACVQMVLSTT
jgi:hypothetical protein